MTNEEAIATLKYQHDYGKMEQEVHDALDMAIKALQQSEPCEDTISRQATINVITKRLYETAFNNIGIKQDIDETLVDVAENRLEKWFDELPSAQPEIIVLCVDCIKRDKCKFYDTQGDGGYCRYGRDKDGRFNPQTGC